MVKMTGTTWTVLVLAIFGGIVVCVADESVLQRHLLANYSSNVRPNSTVNVELALTVTNIIELDIVNQHMVVSGSLIVIWNDYRLSWKPEDFNNVSELYFKVGEIWRPLLVLTNAADEISAVGDNSEQRSIQILLSNTGSLFWVAPAFFKSLCSVDVSLFPFDTQTCELLISSWLFPNDKVNFSTSFPIGLDSYDKNGEYSLVRTYSETRKKRSFGKNPWSFAVFGLELQRRSSYHVINVVLPVLFLEVLGVVVFVVPATSGEKLSYALTMLLSLIVMTTLVAEEIPSTSLQVSVLSIFVLEGVVLSVSELVLTVYILQLLRWHEEHMRPGPFHQLLGSMLSYLCCRKINRVQSIDYPVTEADVTGSTKTVIVVQSKGDPDNGGLQEASTPKDVIETSFKDIAAAIEKVCFTIFTFLTIVFIVHAFLKIVEF